MPNVYSVSEITSIFDTTIQSKLTPQKVRVRGEVREVQKWDDGSPKSFFLRPEDGPGGKRLRCFIPPHTEFKDLPIGEGKKVVVKGQIGLFHNGSQYEVRVSDIKASGVNGNGDNVTDVTEITDRISGLVTGTPELQNIQIQGKIDKILSRSVWVLRDDDNEHYRLNVFKPDAINVSVGDNVCVRGNVSIYSRDSRYQIKVSQDTDIVSKTCECPGHADCCGTDAPCNKACSNPEYTLCPSCYANSPDHEDRVEEAVKNYFRGLGVNEFSPETQHPIQMGTDTRKPDVVLVKEEDGNKIFAAIAECKGAGYVGEGKEQLYSYLSATDTRFGVFANRAKPECWEFYENRRRNRFDCITREEFQAGVVKGITHRKQLKEQISDLEQQNRELREEIQQSEISFANLKNDLSERFARFLAELRSDLSD